MKETSSDSKTSVRRALFLSMIAASVAAGVAAQAPGAEPAGSPIAATAQSPSLAVSEAPTQADLTLAPAKVDVNPVARDEEIRQRLQSVLEATEWFSHPRVRVLDGVVFLAGGAPTAELETWAGNLARNTQDVVAVVNRMVVPQPSVWDLGPASGELRGLWRGVVRTLPVLALALIILALSLGAGMLATRGARVFLGPRVQAALLRKVLARAAGTIVVLLGIYLVLRLSGLTQLALTVVGGTGLIGLALGIAFRDITENFLASIFLSMQRPFETGDLVELAGVTGYVQQLNMRTTVVMAFDGNLVQVPNATVYKSNLRNFTTNPNRRDDFGVGVGYDASISHAQETAMAVLVAHPAVLSDPEPLVLAENLGKSTVDLRVYYWIDGHAHSWLKVRSSVIRLVKRAFQAEGISMPDEAREIVFPHGVAVTVLDQGPVESAGAPTARRPAAPSPFDEPGASSTTAEAGLSSEASTLEEQARQAQPLKQSENLLQSSRLDRRKKSP